MNYKSLIPSAIVFFLSLPVMAQVEQDITRPSINADQFNVGAKAEAALSKGQLSVSIPLMELKGKGYNLPISLAFYGGDVSSSTEASPIGLGWSLVSGGVIAKTIKGADDTVDNGFSKEHFYNDDFLHNVNIWENHWQLADVLDIIRMDPMPDEYSYSLPGHSGTIDVDVDQGTITRKLYPDESYRIEEVERGLCITDDEGNRFYFEDIDSHGDDSSSYFLSRITTVKGGFFTFNYEKEEYMDLSPGESASYFDNYTTHRISSIVSDYGTVTFFSERRDDRNGNITPGLESRRINKIELRDENNNFVKGYELDNSGYFTHFFAPSDPFWTDIRHKLSSVTQYDSEGNKLPPYKFAYSYSFKNSRLIKRYSHGVNGECEPLDAWTSAVGGQAFANLDSSGHPTSLIEVPSIPSVSSSTVSDYFCLDSITYPTGAIEVFTYDKHDYSRVNTTSTYSSGLTIQGRRLLSKKRIGSDFYQQTDYVYKLHSTDDYSVRSFTSGVMTNPSFHRATYYTPADYQSNCAYAASKITSERAYNTYMGTPVTYREVEEIERDRDGGVLSRKIHYYGQNFVQPPVNYMFVCPYSNTMRPSFVEIENRIFGEIRSYNGNPALFNNVNQTYLAYPVGEFSVDTYIGDQPLKEVLIGKEGKVRNVKKFEYYDYGTFTKYGYKIDKEDIDPYNINSHYSIYRFSKTDYNTRRYKLRTIYSTSYYYDGERCDSVCEQYGVHYNKGRESFTSLNRGNESKTSMAYFPDDVRDNTGEGTSLPVQGINGLIEKNIIAGPIKTVIKHDGIIADGECKDYQIVSGMPMLRSVYKIQNNSRNRDYSPSIENDTINYHAYKYKEGEILTYDQYLNPEHIRINECLNRVYVWGYGGRYPIAIIDNMDSETFNASAALKSAILALGNYRKIETPSVCTNLKNTNNAIRNLLPETAHITTFTYDPYYGITSEMDNSNSGMIYIYDSFGRLSAKYDADYKKIEEYNYNYYLQ